VNSKGNRVRTLLALLLFVPSAVLFTMSILSPVIREEIPQGIMDAICHRLPSRCIAIPWGISGLCARCTAFWLGMAAGAAAAAAGRIRLPFWAGFPAVLPLVIDGVVQLHTAYESSNPLRAVTGLLAGIGITLLLFGSRSRRPGSGPKRG